MNKSHNFDWFSLNRDNLTDLMYSISNNIVGKKLTIDQVHNKLAIQARKYLPIKTRKVRNPKTEKGWIYVGGAYYSGLDEEDKKCIEVEFSFNDTDKFITISSKRFTRICIGFADTILHEIIHMRQHRRRNWKVLPDFPSTASRTKQREEQEYLGCRDEIDAYGFNIACELNDRFNGNQSNVTKFLNANHQGKRLRYSSYIGYLNAFGHDHNHHVIKELKKKIIAYLPQATVGKPYKNSEWINH